ncbi:MAG: hypothetical protein U0894_18725 [Pirellulales bacterium]
MSMTPFWIQTQGAGLAQGDMLLQCPVPIFSSESLTSDSLETPTQLAMSDVDLIIVTQSCDLENKKASFVACCPIHTIDAFEHSNPAFKTKGRWEEVRKGRIEGLHLLASPDAPENSRDARVVDFGQIISLPIEFVQQFAEGLGVRWRLQSPFLEHFSQSLARFFMRVGLPSSIPPFK